MVVHKASDPYKDGVRKWRTSGIPLQSRKFDKAVLTGGYNCVHFGPEEFKGGRGLAGSCYSWCWPKGSRVSRFFGRVWKDRLWRRKHIGVPSSELNRELGRTLSLRMGMGDFNFSFEEQNILMCDKVRRKIYLTSPLSSAENLGVTNENWNWNVYLLLFTLVQTQFHLNIGKKSLYHNRGDSLLK